MEDQEYRPKKKKRSRFVRRLRAFVRHMAELPAQTLLVIGGSIAVVLIAVILLVVLLPRGNQAVDGDGASPSPTQNFQLPTFTPSPTPDPTATPHPLTGVGLQGTTGWYLALNNVADIVADIQTRLIELGFMEMPVVDGVEQVTTTYGPATRKAVQMFQAINGITIDGCVGEATYDLLMSDAAKPLTLSRGLDAELFEEAVTKLQTRLAELGYFDSTVTGRYGDTTIEAVKAFQAANGLQNDGIAGEATLTAAYSDNAVRAGQTPVSQAPSASPAAGSTTPAGTTDTTPAP